MFGNLILFGLLYLILLPWTFALFNSSLSVHILNACVIKMRSALTCWDLLVGIQGCNHFASVVGSFRVCTGMEGVASSKFGFAKVNDRPRQRVTSPPSGSTQERVWLNALPLSATGLWMNGNTIRVPMAFHLNVLLCLPHVCQHCGSSMDSLGT